MQTLLTWFQQYHMTLQELINHEYSEITNKYEQGEFLPEDQQYKIRTSNKRWNYHRDQQQQITKRLNDEYTAYNFTEFNSQITAIQELHLPAHQQTTLRERCKSNIVMAIYILPKHIAAIAIAHDLHMIDIEHQQHEQEIYRGLEKIKKRRPQMAKKQSKKRKPKGKKP